MSELDSSAAAAAPIETLRPAEGLLVEDDGTSVLVVHAPHHWRFEDRATTLGLFEKLNAGANGAPAPELTSAERALLDRFVDVGIFEQVEAVPASSAPRRAVPELGTLIVEFTFDDARPALNDAVRRLFDRISERFEGCKRLTLRVHGQDPLCRLKPLVGFVNSVYDVARSHGWIDGTIQWEWYTPLIEIPDGLESTIDSAHGEVTCVLEDRSESDPAHFGPDVIARQLEALKDWSSRGFAFPVHVPTTFPDDLPQRIARWHEANERCGIRVSSLARAHELTSPRTTAILASIESELAAELHRCEPWRAVLVRALTRGRVRRTWRPDLGRIHVTDDGRFARSLEHAAAGIHAALDDLIPENATLLDATGRTPTGLPDCANCGYEPLCAGFATPEFDVARTLGDDELARSIALHSCAIRMRTFETLLRDLRDDRPSQLTDGRSSIQLVYEGDRVVYRAAINP